MLNHLIKTRNTTKKNGTKSRTLQVQKPASEMTYAVSGGALNSTQSNPIKFKIYKT